MLSRPAHARLVPALLGASLLLSVLACGTPERRRSEAQRRSEVQVARRGEDVLAAGDAPQIADSVPGDAMLAGGQITFLGATGGDYLGAGGSQMIAGRIHGSIRAAGGEIRVVGSVARNATIAGGRVEIDRAAIIDRNAYIATGTALIGGRVRQSLQVSGGAVVLDGAVDGDVDVAAGELHVGPRAVIAGNLRYRVPARNVRIDSAAHIGGTVTALPAQDWRGALRFFRALWLFGFLVAGAVAVALAPRFASEAAGRLRERPGQSALVGLLWLLVLPIAAVLVAMTVIGLPLGLLAFVAYAVLLYLGRAVLAVWLGRLVLGARAGQGRSGVIASFLTGGIIIVLVGLLPGIGALVLLVASVFGGGALLIATRMWAHASAAELEGGDRGLV